MLKGLITWLPAMEALHIARREMWRPKSTTVSFNEREASPAWSSGMTGKLDDPLLYAPEVDLLNIEASALMQHYGTDSDFLDCSRSLDVALWFSHHDLCSRAIETSAEDWYQRWFVLQHHFSWYVRASEGIGFFYIFDVHPFEDRLANGDVVELSTFEPGTRPAVQEAALLYGDPEAGSKGDLATYVRAAFSFDVPLRGVPDAVQSKTTQDVFPDPSQDPVYDYLLRLPFYAKDPSASMRLDRMLAIPLYSDAAQNDKNLEKLANFVGRSEQIWPTWVYDHLITLSSENSLRLKADPTSLSKAAVWALGASTNKLPVVDLSVFPDFEDEGPHNLFIEFSPLEVAGTPAGLPRDFVVLHKVAGIEKVSLHRIPRTADLRAIWIRKGVLRGTQGFRLQAFYGWTTASFRSGIVQFLEWPLNADSSNVDEHRFLLRYALSVYYSVLGGILRTKPFASSKYHEVNIELMFSE
jgi:hypothetical protein